MNIKYQKINIRCILIMLATLCLLFTTNLYARTSETPWHPKRNMDYKWYAKNQWRLPITNYGTFGYGINRAGGEWPRGSGNMYIYGAGIWVGALPTRRETLVTSGYDPSSGKSEFTPGCWENATTPGNYARDFERVYIYPEDWPPNPTDFPTSMQDSIPTPLRIPLPTGDTVKGHIYPIPRTTISTADAWTVFNDRDVTLHVNSDPAIGVEIYQYTYSWTLPDKRDIVFFTLHVKNVSGHKLNGMYLAMVCDADIGNAADDMASLILRKYIKNRTGTDSVFCKNVGYCWDSDFSEGWETPPGYVGFDFLQSPYAFDSDHNGNGVIDSVDHIDNNHNGMIDEPAELEQLGLTAFKIFTLAAGDPRDNFAQYMCMTGHNYRAPYDYVPFDSTDVTPADKRFLQATGPFDLDTNAIATVTIAVMAAASNPVGGVGDLYPLALTASHAQSAYDNNWIAPEPPSKPNLTLMPGEGRITLIWDNLPENASDRFYPYSRAQGYNFYNEKDFQGYKIYKSLTGKVGEWELLDQFDKIDGIIWQDTTMDQSTRTAATDKGLSYAYIDSSNIRLGFPYYYAVTAYDINFRGDVVPDTFSLESGMDPKATIARTTPANYSAPKFTVTKLHGGERLHLIPKPMALTSYAVKSDTYTLKFDSVRAAGAAANRIPKYRFLIQNQHGDTVVPIDSFSMNIRQIPPTIALHPSTFDLVITNIKQVTYDTTYSDGTIHQKTRVDTTKAYMPVIDLGFTISMDSIPLQTFDRISVKSGTYPSDSLQIPSIAANYAHWAYRGSDYRIVWTKKRPGDPSSPLTAEVFDLSLGQSVPYRRMRSLTQDADSADGWSLFGGSDTLVINRTLFMTICSGLLNFNLGRTIKILPNAGDTWLIYSVRLSASPAYSEFQIVVDSMQITSVNVNKLKVRVVPNPYLVRNEWERHPDYRKIKFINLPTECTIRIYNFSGDLIKTLTHTATKIADPGNVPLEAGGDEDWNLLTESGQKPAPGIYLFHVESNAGNQVGKFVIIY